MSVPPHRASAPLLLRVLALALLAAVTGCPESTTPLPGDGGGMMADAPPAPDVGDRIDTGARLDTGPVIDAPGVGDVGEPTDAPLAADSGTTTDAPLATDGGTTTDAPAATDAAGTDAGPMCGGFMSGACGAATTCECCPAGGPLERCVCTTTCTTTTDCTDAARPICEIPPGATTGFCRAASFNCCWLCG